MDSNEIIDDQVHVLISEFVHYSFIESADDNYLAARWCFLNQCDITFYCLAHQSIEMLTKAILLLNGMSAKSQSHETDRLITEVRSLAGALIPDILEKPAGLSFSVWDVESPEQFVERLKRNGHPENRYGTFGYAREEVDVVKLDLMYSILRRLCLPLDKLPRLRQHLDSEQPRSNREILLLNPQFGASLFGSKLRDVREGKHGESAKDALLQLNFVLAPESVLVTRHTLTRKWMNPPIGIPLRPLRDGSEDVDAVAKSKKFAKWLLKNVKLDKETQRYVSELVGAQKSD